MSIKLKHVILPSSTQIEFVIEGMRMLPVLSMCQV